MPEFRLVTVMAKRHAPGTELLFLALEDGTFLVGYSTTHFQLWLYYTKAARKDVREMPGIFAAGVFRDGKVDRMATTGFSTVYGTSEEALSVVVEFLAGQAMELAIRLEDTRELGTLHNAVMAIATGEARVFKEL